MNNSNTTIESHDKAHDKAHENRNSAVDSGKFQSRGAHTESESVSERALDRARIIELTARYALAMDEHDVGAWLRTWSPDGVWQGALGTYAGHANLPNLLRDLGERNENRRHILSNHIIDFLADGREAAQTCYMQIVAYKGGCRIVGTAVYRDRLRKNHAGEWLFVERRLALDPISGENGN